MEVAVQLDIHLSSFVEEQAFDFSGSKKWLKHDKLHLVS
jgi:hypothetical protein